MARGEEVDPGPPVEVTVDGEPEDVLRLLEEEVGHWKGEWTTEGPGVATVSIPVLAGVRRGWVTGRVEVTRGADGVRVVFTPTDAVYRIQWPQVAVLLGALGGSLVWILAPIFPVLVPALPLGAVVLLGAWLFIVSTLRNSGPEELLGQLEEPLRPPDDVVTME